jgi:hypothetical protein
MKQWDRVRRRGKGYTRVSPILYKIIRKYRNEAMDVSVVREVGWGEGDIW